MNTPITIAQSSGLVEEFFSLSGIPVLLAIAFCLAFVFSAVVTPLLARFFGRTGFVDEPRRERFSQRKVPKGGGVAIFWAVVLPIVVGLLLVWYCQVHSISSPWLPQGLDVYLPGILSRAGGAVAILVGAAVLHVLGLLDDVRGINPLVKLIVQFVVAIGLVVFFDIRLFTFLHWSIGAMLTVIWIVLLTNVFNFLDNMDGLSAGIAAIVLIMFIWVGRVSQQVFVPTMATVLLGALTGFLLYNFNPARIFMGDSGSLPLGYLVAVISVLTTYYNPQVHQGQWYSALIPLVVLAIPLYDFASVVFLRLRAHRPPWVGDKRHFSHRLIQRGMSQRTAVLTIYLATAATALSARLLTQVKALGAILIFVQVLAVTGIIALLESSKANNDNPQTRENQT